MKDIVIIGSGGFSKQVVEIIELINAKSKKYNLLGFIDDNKELGGKQVLGYKVLGDLSFLKKHSQQNNLFGVIAIADNKIRANIAEQLPNVIWENLIHPNTTVSNHHDMGAGNIISAGVIINPDCVMGNHNHINIGTTLGHDVKLEDYVTIMPGCRISGNVSINNGSLIGTGAVIIQGLQVEENVTLGAGTVLVKNAEYNNTYVGVPSKKLR